MDIFVFQHGAEWRITTSQNISEWSLLLQWNILRWIFPSLALSKKKANQRYVSGGSFCLNLFYLNREIWKSCSKIWYFCKYSCLSIRYSAIFIFSIYFGKNQNPHGMMTQLHFWSRILSDEEMHAFTGNCYFILNRTGKVWRKVPIM